MELSEYIDISMQEMIQGLAIPRHLCRTENTINLQMAELRLSFQTINELLHFMPPIRGFEDLRNPTRSYDQMIEVYGEGI